MTDKGSGNREPKKPVDSGLPKRIGIEAKEDEGQGGGESNRMTDGIGGMKGVSQVVQEGKYSQSERPQGEQTEQSKIDFPRTDETAGRRKPRTKRAADENKRKPTRNDRDPKRMILPSNRGGRNSEPKERRAWLHSQGLNHNEDPKKPDQVLLHKARNIGDFS